MSKAASYMQSNGVKFTTFWLDIEGPGTYWGSDTSANAAFFEDLLAGVQQAGAYAR